MNKNDICALIKNDPGMMDVLKTARSLDLPDWWIGAGFVRSKVWDYLHNYTTRTILPDIDVIYFDKNDISEKSERMYEKKLSSLLPDIKWSVKNQAKMHTLHHHAPYNSSKEALSHWVETATCVGVKLDEKNELMLIAPHGIYDLIHLILRPTPGEYPDTKIFYERIEKKQWLQKWPKLRIMID